MPRDWAECDKSWEPEASAGRIRPQIPPKTPYLKPGSNVIAVALEDHGSLTAFDMQVTANAIPDPASTFTLLCIGLGAVGLMGLRFKS